MNGRVAVFHPGVQHAYETALAFQDAGQLAWFATSIFYVPERWPYRVAAWTPAGLRARLEYEFRRRYHPDLNPALVRTFGFLEWIERVGMRLGLRSLEHYANEFGNVMFGRQVGRLAKADDVGVLWGFDTASLNAFRRAKQRGIRCVLEQSIGHPRVWNQLLSEERQRVGDAFDPYPLEYPERDLAKVEGELLLADRVVCGSQFVRQTLLSQGVGDRKISVVPSGAATEAFMPAPRPRPGPELQLIFAGHFGVRKGAWYLLEAMRLLQDDRRITLTLVGKRTVPDRYLAPMGDRVQARPHVSRATMADVYRAADVFILPSLFEGSAIAIYEAMACGLPVITTPNAGSVVRDGVDGFIVPIRDAAALADRIRRLADDPALRLEMGANARIRALAHPWSAYRARLVNLMHQWNANGWS
jgi:glycosyltransferase involved in cell wall biosynthesis